MAPEPTIPAPATPGRRSGEELRQRIAMLNTNWGLGIPLTSEWSPNKSERTLEDGCVRSLNFCLHKKIIGEALKSFQDQADEMYKGWVRNPRGERGVVPEKTRHRPHPVTEVERLELLSCLKITLDEHKFKWQGSEFSPLSVKSASTSFNDKSVPFSLSPQPGTETKRSRDSSFPDLTRNSKKAKMLKVQQARSFDMPPPDRGRSYYQDPQSSKSANTSFAASEASIIFSRPSFGASTVPSTQDTVPDDDLPKTQEDRPAFTTIREDKTKSSDYASSSFERAVANIPEEDVIEFSCPPQSDAVDAELSQDLVEFGLCESEMYDAAEDQLITRLKGVFPVTPVCLRPLPTYVIYEITRVFLHAQVSLSELKPPVSDSLEDYDTLWRFLKSLPALQNVEMPERCRREVWDMAMNKTPRSMDSAAVVLAGSLQFDSNVDRPFFRLRLDPLRLDKSHRLGRRFGNDRFMEICLPLLTGRQLPEILIKLGAKGQQIIYDWLVDSKHSLLDRQWMPFFTQPKERRPRKVEPGKDIENVEPAFRVYFFAVSGHGFVEDRRLIANPEAGTHTIMTIAQLLNRVRPTRKNVEGSYLKLFSRISLALSRNSATVVLKPSEIRFIKRDITCSDSSCRDLTCNDPQREDEVFNDGAGRISPSLAQKIIQKLGIDYSPSAFQGRLGEAKGLWVVDYMDRSRDDWIEVFPSQQKWKRSTKPNGESDDLSHRTFELVNFSGPLRSADLNAQFLPLLVDRAEDKNKMKHALSEILKQGLAQEVAILREAVEDPLTFRQWVRTSNSNIKERLKNGTVSYRAGLPIVFEERLNVMLDAGFQPKSTKFMAEQTRALFRSHTDELKKRLNITVGKSAYAYMVPDFWGVLEPGEVYIDFSSFVDGISGFSGALLNDVNVLVARSPAHFVSDIQKVKSVVRVELMGLKDVIVFPTKGHPSLAAKLSGGDYDGDVAWVCWEESIVNNFITADVPPPINLFKEGLLRKDPKTYEELVKGHDNTTSLFLKKAFEFNMRPRMLGICTSWKERICYTSGDLNSKEVRYLSQLLSDLVDAPKQGSIFEDEDWTRFKAKCVKTVPCQPKWQPGYPREMADHINDHLMLVAEETVEKGLVDIYQALGQPPSHDDCLIAPYKLAAEHASREPQWKDMLQQLINDLETIKSRWKQHFNRVVNDEDMPEFQMFLAARYEDYREIRPHVDNAVSQSLLFEYSGTDELSNWELLKASTLFNSYIRPRKDVQHVSNFVWWMAGKQLNAIKAKSGKGQPPHLVTSGMYIALKPDSVLTKRLTSQRYAGVMDSGSVTNVEELEALEDDG